MADRVEVFFDGDCPLCVREIKMLRSMDRKGRIQFTDIAEPGFEAEKFGRTHEEFMARIHGRDADGQWIEGVDVFRALYGAVGFGPLVGLTRIPGISHSLDLAYCWFAKIRLRITGRGAVCDEHACVPQSAHSA